MCFMVWLLGHGELSPQVGSADVGVGGSDAMPYRGPLPGVRVPPAARRSGAVSVVILHALPRNEGLRGDGAADEVRVVQVSPVSGNPR